ncbi:MAG: BamA/TamA family outer membrane protein [Phycisphaerales bacterium]|nr:MAG: BamA/TamA family outer membrane protein [Phycisphaerales bacterium]
MRNVIMTIFISTAVSSVVMAQASEADLERESQTTEPALESGVEVIKSIEFENNRKYKDKALLKRLDFAAGEYLDPVLAESGRAAIEEFYRSKGYPHIVVTLDNAKLAEGEVVYSIVEGPRIRIKSVRFEGNKALKTGDLHNTIKTRTTSWLIRPVYYTEEKIAADVERLRELYYQRGYLNHRIGVQGQSDITFTIEEGPLYRVRNVTFRDNTHFDDETLLAGLELESGQPYYQRKAQTHERRILKLYRESGFIDAQVTSWAKFVTEVNTVDVEFTVVEGRQFRIGRIDIVGNEQTQDKVVRRILDEYDFTPGALYNADRAPRQGGGQLERYVQRMTLAEEAMIRPVVPANGAEDQRDAVVDIKEGMTGMLNPGVAIGSDSGIIGRLIIEQRNFDITDWPESFDDFIMMRGFKGGGQSLRIALEPGTIVSYYSVTFREPYFRDRPTSLDVGGSQWERWRESYDEERTKGYFGFEKRLKNRWRPSLDFRLENVEVGALEYDAPQEIIDVKGNNLLAGARVGIGKDMRDDIYMPSKGYRFKVGYEEVTGDEDFGIVKGTAVGYTTLYEDLLERKTVLAVKVLAATTLSDAPPFEKFYAGGTGEYGIRGFDYRGVSTRGLQTGVPNPVRKDPIGSDWVFLANTEVTIPLHGESIAALLFLDSGTIDTGRYRAAAGAGIQIMIPQLLGPVPMRFEFSKPLRRDEEDETRTFSFNMGRLF